MCMVHWKMCSRSPKEWCNPRLSILRDSAASALDAAGAVDLKGTMEL